MDSDINYDREIEKYYQLVKTGQASLDEADEMIESEFTEDLDRWIIQGGVLKLIEPKKEPSFIIEGDTVSGDTFEGDKVSGIQITANNSEGFSMGSSVYQRFPSPSNENLEPKAKRRRLSTPEPDLQHSIHNINNKTINEYMNNKSLINFINQNINKTKNDKNNLSQIPFTPLIRRSYSKFDSPLTSLNNRLCNRFDKLNPSLLSPSVTPKVFNKRPSIKLNEHELKLNHKAINKKSTRDIRIASNEKNRTRNPKDSQSNNLHEMDVKLIEEACSDSKSTKEKAEKLSKKNNKNELVQEKDFKQLLTEWKLERYIGIFQREGYDIVEDWNDLTKQELKDELEMPNGHIKRFLKKVKNMKKN